jgi:hypothetical protein
MPQAATASSLSHLVRSHGRPHLFLTAPEPPLARVWPSTEASHSHGAASLPSSSNRLVILTPGQAPIGRLTAARIEHVASELLSSPSRLTVCITEQSPPMPPTDELLRHQCHPRHPECVAPPSPSKPPRRRSERAAPPPSCLHVHVRCRPPSPIAPAPRCHLCASRQRPGVRLDVALSSHCQG